MTHGDRIRRMTDEELVGILHCNQCIYLGMPECETPDCIYGIMTWLKQEVGEEVGTDSQTIKLEVRHGKWIPLKGWFNKSIVKCSVCGNTLDMNGVNAGRGDANFCPNCGADMREVREDETS